MFPESEGPRLLIFYILTVSSSFPCILVFFMSSQPLFLLLLALLFVAFAFDPDFEPGPNECSPVLPFINGDFFAG